jgi:hypothetical protein
MGHEPLDEWIASFFPTHSLRQIARTVPVGNNRVRAVRDAHIAGIQLFHRLGSHGKATPPIKQDVIELTIHHPNFSDLQIAELISERYSIVTSGAPNQKWVSSF